MAQYHNKYVGNGAMRYTGLLWALALASCAPSYDSAADQLQLATQQKIDAALIRLAADSAAITANAQAATAAKADAAYSANVATYADIVASLTALQSRLTAAGNPAATQEATSVGKIIDNIKILQQRHAADNMLPTALITGAQANIDQQFIPLNLYQVQLQSGAKS